MQQSSIRESPRLIMKCVFAEAHTVVQLLLESLCLSTPLSSLLPPLFISDHSREAMSCFIHWDASPTVLNPFLSLSLSSEMESLANFNKFVRAGVEGSRCLSWSLHSLIICCATLNDRQGNERIAPLSNWKHVCMHVKIFYKKCQIKNILYVCCNHYKYAL